jgi:hypothetical protein
MPGWTLRVDVGSSSLLYKEYIYFCRYVIGHPTSSSLSIFSAVQVEHMLQQGGEANRVWMPDRPILVFDDHAIHESCYHLFIGVSPAQTPSPLLNWCRRFTLLVFFRCLRFLHIRFVRPPFHSEAQSKVSLHRMTSVTTSGKSMTTMRMM